ncbi:MAG TPA: hypothetical protein VNM41_04640 [Solirubrobacterales bacterium]|nr:hypothetical protein [Solirubrobacterales bacterium]
MSFERLRERLTYANVVATIALIFAVGGGATAIALSLPKNSVKSKQIAKEAVKTSDIAKDAVTGDKVKESTLGKVPSAAHADTAGRADSAGSADHAGSADTAGSLTGFNPSSVAKVQSTSSDSFNGGLSLKIQGFGTYSIVCEDNTASPSDDEVTLGYQTNGLPANALEGGFSSSAGFPLDSTEDRVIAASNPTNGTFTNQDDRIYYSYSVAVPGTTKALNLFVSAFDNEATSGCAGQMQAYVIS